MTALLLGSVRKIDNFDDRKEIVIQLGHLTSEQRINYLKWAIDQAPINKRQPTRKPLRVVVGTPGSKESPFPWGSAEQCYFDLMMAIQQHAVPIDIVLAELERRASKKLVACG
jgi:hypothetical protein